MSTTEPSLGPDISKDLELFLLRLRYREGRLAQVEGNNPVLINDPESAWVVYTGKVDIFAVQMYDGEAVSPRSHVARITAGNVFFGMDMGQDTHGLRLLAVGMPGTQVLRVRVRQLRELAGEVEFSPVVAGMLETWVRKLSAVFPAGQLPKDPVFLDAGTDTHIDVGKAASARGGVRWVQILEGSVLLADRDDLPAVAAPEIVPLAALSWLTPTGPGRVRADDTSVVVEAGSVWPSLARFHQLAFAAVQHNVAENVQAAELRLKTRIDRREVEREAGLETLATLLDQESAPHAAVTAPADPPLLKAATIVAAQMGIDFTQAAARIRAEREPLTVPTVARLAAIRSRRVSLRGTWWREDSGPLIAFRKDGGAAVALTTSRPGRYVLHDVENGARMPVDAAVAATLEPDAWMFYRPFTREAIELWDLLKFGMHGSRRDLITIVLAGAIGGLLTLITPLASQFIFDTAVPDRNRAELVGAGVVLLIFAVVGLLIQLARSFAIQRVEGKLDHNVQGALWDRLLSLPAPFFRQYTAGDLGTRAMSINVIRQVISGPTVNTILNGIFSTFNLILLFYYNATLALAAIALVVISAALTIWAGVVQIRYQRLVAHEQGLVSGIVLQILNGIAKFRVVAGEDRAFARWADAFSKQRLLTYKAGKVQNRLLVFNSAFPLITSLVIFGGVALSGGAGMSTGQFVAFNTAFLQLLTNGIMVSSAIITILSVVPLYERAKPILEAAPESDPSKISPGDLTGRIEVSHAWFRYNEEGAPILKDVSIEVNPGEFVAVVGPTGSGKSTLLRLLLGFEKPESGAVFYDGQDMSTLDVQEVRRQIGTVIQNGQLMSGILLQNIIGSSLLTIDDAWDASRQVGLEPDIRRMPMGMFTLVSDEGATLSGGQRQRLLIARALVNKPRIVFLDEATSALDNATQDIVAKNMDNLRVSRVVIAHRLSTIINADRIYVMKDGEIIQQGSYSDLLSQPGLFADLARRQMG